MYLTKHNIQRLMSVGAAIAVAAAIAGCGGSSDHPAAQTAAALAAPTPQQLATTCSGLKGTKIGDVTVTATKRSEASGDNPAFCQVLGSRAPFLDIEVDVPDDWSGRLWQQGGGGFDGQIPSALATDAATGLTTLDLALKTGRSVYAASNGGNRAAVPAQAGPLVWVNGTQDGVASAQDYAYAALNTTREFAKAVAKAFYGKPPVRSYFNGCSNGGRNAYIAAERWPQEYDGIVSGCEGMDMASQTAAWMSLGAKAGTPAGLSPQQWGAVSAASVAACDGLDGVTDGVIANNAACKFDVGTVQCGQAGASADPAACLTAAQVQTVRDLTSDIKSADGATLYAAYSWSSNWPQFAPGFGVLGGGFALLATGDPTWFTQLAKQQSFVLERDYPIFRYGLRLAGADHDKSKVAAYVASGRKLISWHAGSDNLLSPNEHIRNYATMTGLVKTMGVADPSANTRFFMVPGATHGQGGTLTEVNWFEAITNWVEKNTAPTQLVYNRRSATGALRTLPVCQNPQFAKYNGTGDVNLAASYTCATP